MIINNDLEKMKNFLKFLSNFGQNSFIETIIKHMENDKNNLELGINTIILTRKIFYIILKE